MDHKPTPCMGCSERHTACHDHCDKYAGWKAELQKQKDNRKEYIRKRREDWLHSEECQSSKEKWRQAKRHGR